MITKEKYNDGTLSQGTFKYYDAYYFFKFLKFNESDKIFLVELFKIVDGKSYVVKRYISESYRHDTNGPMEIAWKNTLMANVSKKHNTYLYQIFKDYRFSLRNAARAEAPNFIRETRMKRIHFAREIRGMYNDRAFADIKEWNTPRAYVQFIKYCCQYQKNAYIRLIPKKLRKEATALRSYAIQPYIDRTSTETYSACGAADANYESKREASYTAIVLKEAAKLIERGF